MTDKCLKIRINGKILRELMENGVSLWPSLDGRWPVISGFKFEFDPKKPAGSRIISLKK
jgi:5'-nucleotidase